MWMLRSRKQKSWRLRRPKQCRGWGERIGGSALGVSAWATLRDFTQHVSGDHLFALSCEHVALTSHWPLDMVACSRPARMVDFRADAAGEATRKRSGSHGASPYLSRSLTPYADTFPS